MYEYRLYKETRDTVVILIVQLLVIIKIIKDAWYVY